MFPLYLCNQVSISITNKNANKQYFFHSHYNAVKSGSVYRYIKLIIAGIGAIATISSPTLSIAIINLGSAEFGKIITGYKCPSDYFLCAICVYCVATRPK